MKLIDQVILGKNYQMLRLLLAIWFLLLIITPLIHALKKYHLDYFELQFELEVKHDLFAKVLYLPLSFFNARQAGYIQSRIENDVNQLHSLTAGSVLAIVNNLVNCFFGGCMMLAIHPQLTILSLATILILIVNNYLFARPLKAINKKISEAWSKVMGNLLESILGIETIKAFGLERQKALEYQDKYRLGIHACMKRTMLEIFANFFKTFVSGLGPLVIWGYGAVLIISRQLTLGQLTAFVGYSGFMFGPALDLASLKLNLQPAMAAWERIEEIFTLADERAPGKTRPSGCLGKISFQEVSFAYDPERGPAIRGISLEALPGEKVALVGENGAGKSTLVKLLLGFYPGYQGRILIDGHDITKLDAFWLREQIAFISQDVFLFNDSVFENIRLYNPAIGEADIKAAISALNLDSLINSFPEGYETIIQERGAGLSGGQKQLISLARAAVKKNAGIVVLDEPTAALDPLIEEFFCRRIDKIFPRRTLLLIAHKPALLKAVDRVIWLREGRIVFSGPSEDFLRGGAGDNGPTLFTSHLANP